MLTTKQLLERIEKIGNDRADLIDLEASLPLVKHGNSWYVDTLLKAPLVLDGLSLNEAPTGNLLTILELLLVELKAVNDWPTDLIALERRLRRVEERLGNLNITNRNG